MDDRDAEMGETGKLLEDEVMGGQESAENNQLVVNDTGGNQQESPGLVNEDDQNPNEVRVKEEEQKLSVNAAEEEKLGLHAEAELHPDQSEQELLVVETHDLDKDAKAMDEDDPHNSEKDATAVDDDNAYNREKDPAAVDDGNGVQGQVDCDALVKMPEDGNEADDTGHEKHHEPATPNNVLVTRSASKAEDHSAETPKKELEDTKMDEGYESGTLEDQAAFMKDLETFCREKNLEFKPLKFYGQPLNYLKLWRSVIKLGGYDHVTGSKLWRQIGESFNPPKTCTTVSWTFRIFYEKALLEYERHKILSGELELPLAIVNPEVSTVENEANGCQTPGSGRARRDAAARAMQGWHTQRLSGYGEVSEPIIKDKSSNNSQKREKSLKSIGSLKQKRPSEVEHPVKAARTETSRQVVSKVADVGPPADWVKVNVRETKDSYEVFALVPGLLREEVRVQSDPAGRLVITGQPEQLDNPWGITPFKKVISLPSRIDPLHTSAIVSLHGQLYVHVPFERPNV